MGQERAIGYVRVSTDEQHVSPEDQRRRIAAWCDAFAHELVAIYADEGVSGSVPLAERPEGRHADHAIARALNDERVPTKRGGRWQANTVYRSLAREDADTGAAPGRLG